MHPRADPGYGLDLHRCECRYGVSIIMIPVRERRTGVVVLDRDDAVVAVPVRGRSPGRVTRLVDVTVAADRKMRRIRWWV